MRPWPVGAARPRARRGRVGSERPGRVRAARGPPARANRDRDQRVGRAVEQIQASGPSVEQAVEVALTRLGVGEQEVEVEILQESRSSFLGMGGQEAVVLVRLKRRADQLTEDELDEEADVAADFLEDVLARIGIDASVEPNLEDGTMYVDILVSGPDDDDMALLIGRHGQTLEALQELTRHVVLRKTGLRCRIVVDVEDYKKRQRDRLIARARDVAKRVARTGQEEELEAMTPYERKVVHDAVASVEGVESSSRGEDPDRLRRRHVLDCLRAASVVSSQDLDAYDLGSGAGLPGVVVAIARPDLRITLVEARRRRAAFLELAAQQLHLENVTVAAARLETLIEPVDLCFARALAPLPRAWTLAEPLLRPGGRLVY